jgi:hypothetical protein
MTAIAQPRRALALALVTALGASAPADPAAAQAAVTSFQVIRLNYAPAQPTPGLDLRPGRHLLQLQGTSTGGYEGLLRGPRNEIIAERIALRANSGCAAGAPSSAVLRTHSLPGQPDLNVLGIEIGNTAGGCPLRGTLPTMGLTKAEKPDVSASDECDEPVVGGMWSTTAPETDDSSQSCSIEDWDPPIAVPRPDLKPGHRVNLAGRDFLWVERARLQASEAIGFRDGRCLFSYAYTVENVGRARSGETEGSMLLQQRYGLQLDASVVASLPPGGTQRIQGQLALPPGIWQVFAHVDSSAQVVEWNGRNNARSLIVEIAGTCASSPQ